MDEARYSMKGFRPVFVVYIASTTMIPHSAASAKLQKQRKGKKI